MFPAIHRTRWAYALGGLLLAAWLAVVAVGLWRMLDFELRPANTAPAVSQWPALSHLVRDQERPTLVAFVHPRCPCSRASVREVGVLATQFPGQLDLLFVFVKPPGFEAGWERADLWRAAERIPGARLLCDEGGMEAARFRATTSGESMLFAPDGRLLFHGGVTASRGHEGDNAGRTTLALLVDNAMHERMPAVTPPEAPRMAVYGCALSNTCCRSARIQAPCDCKN